MSSKMWMMTALLTACTGTKTDTGTINDTGDDTLPAAENGLPTGSSEWEGTLVVSGFEFPATASIDNQGGDLSGTVTFSDNPDTPLGFGKGVYSVTGTHDPVSGRVAIAPEDWITPPKVALELLGLSGTYDPDSGTITGMVADYASGSDNSLNGGAATMVVTGDGEPLGAGDSALALPAEERAFSGTMQCTGPEREVEGLIRYDGVGDVEGTITFGDPTLDDLHETFEFTGVHNPSTGGVTIVPGLFVAPERTFVSFFVEATFDPDADTLDGGMRQNVGTCPELWQAGF